MSLSIGLVCPYALDQPGGVQNHVLGLADHLRTVGHRVHVLAPGLPGPGNDRLDPQDFCSAGPAWPVPYNGSIARVNFGPRTAARVRGWLEERDLDLVHLHEPITPSISLLALRAARPPVVATFHTATPRSKTMQVARGVLRRSLAKIDAGIAVSEAARDVVVQHLGRDPQIIPNGFAFEDYNAPLGDRGTPGRLERSPRLVFLGRSDEPRKGLDVLLAAAPDIRARFPGLEIVVAGGGRRCVPPWCRELGLVSESAKVALIRSADIFVAPHRERESFGIVLLEAMAAGAAVVASDLEPFVELLGPPRAGRIFAAGDHLGLAQAVAEVLERPDRGRLLAAQESARRYDWSVVGPRIAQVYADVLGVAPPKTPAARPGRLRVAP